jgi:hypothetical protein
MGQGGGDFRPLRHVEGGEEVKAIKPNTVLPRGGRLIKVSKKKIGGWNPMKYDAKVVRFGLRIYRVAGGMGGANDREDWVVDVPHACVSVHCYQWRPPRWGFEKFSSFDEVIEAMLTNAVGSVRADRADLLIKATNAEKCLRLLKTALSRK